MIHEYYALKLQGRYLKKNFLIFRTTHQCGRRWCRDTEVHGRVRTYDAFRERKSGNTISQWFNKWTDGGAQYE